MNLSVDPGAATLIPAESQVEVLEPLLEAKFATLGRDKRWKVRGFEDAMKGSNSRPPWVIEDLLLGDSATLVSAQPHAMKSLSLLYACLEAVTKKTVWGHFAAPNVDSVLFLETEDPPWLVESRIRGLGEGLGIGKKEAVEGFHYACVGPF